MSVVRNQATIVAVKSSPAYRVEIEGFLIRDNTITIAKIITNSAWDASGLFMPFKLGETRTYTEIANYFMVDRLFDSVANGVASQINEGLNDTVGKSLVSMQTSGPVGTFTVASQPVPNNSTFVLTIKFNRAVSGFVAGDIVFTGGASIGSLSTADNIAFTGTVTTTNSPGTPITCSVSQGLCVDATTGKNNVAFAATFTRS